MATPEQYISPMMNLVSDKQVEALNVIARGNPDGSHVDMHQLRQRLSYDPHVNSVRFMLRYMLAQGRIVIVDVQLRKNEAGRVCRSRTFRITELGRSLIRSEVEKISAM